MALVRGVPARPAGPVVEELKPERRELMLGDPQRLARPVHPGFDVGLHKAPADRASKSRMSRVTNIMLYLVFLTKCSL